jgi:hypothetical protein
MSLSIEPTRFEKYQEIWTKFNPNVKGIVWNATMSVCFPWHYKTYLWRTLRSKLETRFRAVICEHLGIDMTMEPSETTMEPMQPFSFMDYSDMLLKLLDIYLRGLDDYIYIQDMISEVSRNMDAYPEDEIYFLEEGLYKAGFSRAKEFLDVILFMHEVPQRALDRWDALDHESDVTWFREHCKVYQNNEPLMAFLRDCAVVVLMTGFFVIPAEVKSIHDCYTLHADQGNTPPP